MNVTDPLINPLIFISFCYREWVHDNKEFSHWNSKPSHESMNPFSWSLNNFYLSTFSANLNFDKIFQNKGKILCWGHFCPEEIFPKNSGKVQLEWSPTIYMSKIQSRLGWPSNQKLFHHYQHAKIIQSICSIHQIICEIHLI